MKNLLRVELYKVFHNRFFWITFSLAILLALMSAMERIQNYQRIQSLMEFYSTKNLMVSGDTLYNNWIGGEFGTLAAFLFYFLLPLFAAFPYGWSLVQEQRAGYVKNVIARSGRKNYYLSKYIANFTAAATVAAIPLLLNLLLVACFIPARMPDPICQVYYAVFGADMWAGLFYSAPLCYVFLYFVLTLLFAGVWAQLSYVAAFYLKNRAAVLIIPYLLLLAFHYGTQSLFAWRVYVEASPIYFLRGPEITNQTVWWVVLLEMLFLFLLGIGIFLRRGLRDDVF